MKIKHNLARLRYAHGFNQQEVANLVGCSRSAILSIEGLRLPLSVKLATKLAEALNVSAIWLLNNDLTTPIPHRATIEIDWDTMEWL